MELKIGRPEAMSAAGVSGTAARLEYPGGEFRLNVESTASRHSVGSEAFFVAALVVGMKRGVSLRLEQPVSPRLLQAADGIQDIFHAWDRSFRRVNVVAQPRPVYNEPSARRVGCFFSGGVDSFFTLIQHREEIDSLIFVHGFDVRLQDTDVWARVSGPIRAAAAELGKPLIELRTNIQQFSDGIVDWNLYHGSAMASVAHSLGPMFYKVYIPATHTYERLRPWGSHPLVDPLWSTEALEIAHDGCEASRNQKIRTLATCETALKYLRVCYNNRQPGWRQAYNCGHCEKCLRTQINLYLAGALDRCPTLAHELDYDAISQLPIRNEGYAAYFQDSLEIAERSGADPALIGALRHALQRYSESHAALGLKASLAALRHLEQENAELNRSFAAMRRSKSWQLTQPLRSLAQASRRFTGKTNRVRGSLAAAHRGRGLPIGKSDVS